MGFRYRKSINIGAGFRVNISTSEIGCSWGVKGYRITKTADGKIRRTLSLPGTGLSYVEEHRIGGLNGKNNSSARNIESNPLDNCTDIKHIESSDASKLRSAEYSDLFKQIKLFKAGAIAIIALAVICARIVWLPYVIAALLLAYCYFCRCSIEYEFDDYAFEKWSELRSAWESVASSKDLQQIVVTTKNKNSRVMAGIQNGIQTVGMKSAHKLPWYIKTNVKPVVFVLKGMKLAIMPDRMLIFDKKMGAVSYDEAKIDVYAYGLATGHQAPADAEVIKYVWHYANNDGSPDKRYSNNSQFPVIKYGGVDISSTSGLDIRFLFSNIKAADILDEAIHKNDKQGITLRQ